MKEHTARWRLLLVPPRSGAENMARDAGLMDRARKTGEAVFSVYGWTRPTLSLGRNQTARGEYDLAEARQREIEIVRRPTGGRALLHSREVTYSVTGPIEQSESLADAYARINRILLLGLRKLGVNASEAERANETPRPGLLPCFAAPTEGELVTQNGKLVGSAQYRENGALLQHGSILIEDDQDTISALLLDRSSSDVVPGAATLRQALGRMPSASSVADALFDAVRELCDVDTRMLDENETRGFTALHIETYRSELWTWRR